MQYHWKPIEMFRILFFNSLQLFIYNEILFFQDILNAKKRLGQACLVYNITKK